MSRIPTHTVDNAPAASRPLLQKIVQSTREWSAGKLARPDGAFSGGSDSVHIATRRACRARHLDPKAGAALTLAGAAGVGNSHMILIASRLAHMNGWTEEQVSALTMGISTDDAKVDALTALVWEAAACGKVTDSTAPGRRLSNPAGAMSN